MAKLKDCWADFKHTSDSMIPGVEYTLSDGQSGFVPCSQFFIAEKCVADLRAGRLDIKEFANAK